MKTTTFIQAIFILSTIGVQAIASEAGISSTVIPQNSTSEISNPTNPEKKENIGVVIRDGMVVEVTGKGQNKEENKKNIIITLAMESPKYTPPKFPLHYMIMEFMLALIKTDYCTQLTHHLHIKKQKGLEFSKKKKCLYLKRKTFKNFREPIIRKNYMT